jgi:hypothetical protein
LVWISVHSTIQIGAGELATRPARSFSKADSQFLEASANRHTSVLLPLFRRPQLQPLRLAWGWICGGDRDDAIILYLEEMTIEFNSAISHSGADPLNFCPIAIEVKAADALEPTA